MNERPTVYVVQDTTYALAGATDFGDLVFLLPKLGQTITYMNQPAVREMRGKLKNYDGRRDYVLPVGDPAAIGIAVALAAERSAGLLQLLRYDKHQKRYFAVKVDLYDRFVRPEGAVA